MAVEPNKTWIDHIPAIWLEPVKPQADRRLVIFLTGLSGSKEDLLPYLNSLAEAGCDALSFDNWEHGERTSLNSQQIVERAFSNFRRYMWVYIGQTALDTLRVIDWAVENLGVEPQVSVGGLSMGGDIAVAAAGIDPRIHRVGALAATPDWRRPGMVDLRRADHTLLPAGAPDAYARHFYELYNPITNLAHYAHAPAIHFINGEIDDHVPPEAAYRFKSALAELYPQAAANITIHLLPGVNHSTFFNAQDQWWPELRDFLCAS